jgi:hypothetical protein
MDSAELHAQTGPLHAPRDIHGKLQDMTDTVSCMIDRYGKLLDMTDTASCMIDRYGKLQGTTCMAGQGRVSRSKQPGHAMGWQGGSGSRQAAWSCNRRG